MVLRHTENGIEIWQQKYRQAALIDPVSLKVKSVKAGESPKAALALSINDRRMETRNRIYTGQLVSLKANQNGIWDKTPFWMREHSRSADAFSFWAQEAGSFEFMFKSDCEVLAAVFDIEPLKSLSSADSFSTFIAKGEGDYNSVNTGKPEKRDLVSMTIEEILNHQKNNSFGAVGKYQIIQITLETEVMRKMRLDGRPLTGKEKFNEEMQEKIGAYLVRPEQPPTN